MRPQRWRDPPARELVPRVWMWRLAEDGPQPRFVSPGTQRQPGSMDAQQLLSQAIGKAAFLDLQFFEHARQLAQLKDRRIVGANSPERPLIGAQRVGGDMRIPAIVFCPASAKSVAKA